MCLICNFYVSAFSQIGIVNLINPMVIEQHFQMMTSPTNKKVLLTFKEHFSIII